MLQHFFFKSQESVLNFTIIQWKWQKVGERLLPSEVLNKDFNSCDRRRYCSFVGACDDC